MKPLLKEELPNFVKRFGGFVDAEIRSITPITPSQIQTVIAVQDSARGFDWLTLTLEFTDISDAKLLDDSKLSLVDMSDGLTIIQEQNTIYFAVGEYQNTVGIKNAICFIISSSLKYEEGLF